jgi:hypothetical protein
MKPNSKIQKAIEIGIIYHESQQKADRIIEAIDDFFMYARQAYSNDDLKKLGAAKSMLIQYKRRLGETDLFKSLEAALGTSFVTEKPKANEKK